MPLLQSQGWHQGEYKIRDLTGTTGIDDNPTSPFLSPGAAQQVQRNSLLALGTLDVQDRPWTTLWGGEPPFAQQVAPSALGIRTDVDASFDPFVEAIWGGRADGELVKDSGTRRMISGLSTQLEDRKRVKLFGRMVGGALKANTTIQDDPLNTKASSDVPGRPGKAGDAQLIINIEQSLGNCPKYLNRKHITSYVPRPRLLSSSAHLSQEALDLISKADLFFMSTAHKHEDMDTNHRGGPPGFVRAQQPADISEGSTIVWPEYSGNNLYQSLGNLMTTPQAGIVIPEFETGDVLYVTGETEVLIGARAGKVIAKSKLAVQLKVAAARLVQNGLPFRGAAMNDSAQGRSPYNPRVRYLASEKTDELAKEPGQVAPVTAKLIQKTALTPTINRYRLALSDPSLLGPWKPGQYVALDFSEELDVGYSHMREDDPTSLNDDFLRTFTVSSMPGSLGMHGEEFELTVREVGSVTRWLSRQRPGLAEVGVRGFGGEFRFKQDDNRWVGFIAAGIGITPLLGQMGELDLRRLTLLWSVGIKDVGLVLDVLRQYPSLKELSTIFVNRDGSLKEDRLKEEYQDMLDIGAKIESRRIAQDDLVNADSHVDDWCICTPPNMRNQVQQWLPSKSMTFENFDY